MVMLWIPEMYDGYEKDNHVGKEAAQTCESKKLSPTKVFRMSRIATGLGQWMG